MKKTKTLPVKIKVYKKAKSKRFKEPSEIAKEIFKKNKKC